jgi:CheY-like chemotaxis protein
MIVDDDEDDRFLFREALSEIDGGIKCREARNGCEALEQLEDLSLELPALIFLDINMPIMNGWECLEKIRNSGRFGNIPVFVYSTSSHQRDIDRALQLGAYCFCTKVDDYDKLKKMLEVIVANLSGDLKGALRGNVHARSCHFTGI